MHNDDWPEGQVPTEWVDLEVHKMRCMATVSGQMAHFVADLVFVSGDAYAVFEWADYESGHSVPDITVKLERRHLHPLPEQWAPVRWMYELPIDDPRHLH